MEMKVSPGLLLYVSVTVQLALPQYQLRVRPSPSEHLPVPDLQEHPDPALEPGERDLVPRFLRRKLGSSFDPLYSSIGPPTRGNGSEIGFIGRMPREFQKLDFTDLKGPKTQRRIRQWLWSYTRCSVLSVWKDLGVRFWPRYVKEGRCTSERSCSLPEGMFCKPVESVSVTLLRWHCRGSRALKSCAWIRARYPVISRCGTHSLVSLNIKMSKAMTTDKGLNTKPDPRPVKNNLPSKASRPDWILYTVPASAFLIGIILFAFICKTQRHRKTHVEQRTYKTAQVDNYSSFKWDSTDGVQSIKTKKKDDAQSYENVEAAIYLNQEKVSYYVPADEDYITPDEVNEQDDVGSCRIHQDSIQLPQNLTDTESYEMMADLNYPYKEACDTTEDDYINPDDNGHDYADIGSYEMMADSDYVYNNTAVHYSTDDSYEKMDEIPFHKEIDG